MSNPNTGRHDSAGYLKPVMTPGGYRNIQPYAMSLPGHQPENRNTEPQSRSGAQRLNSTSDHSYIELQDNLTAKDLQKKNNKKARLQGFKKSKTGQSTQLQNTGETSGEYEEIGEPADTSGGQPTNLPTIISSCADIGRRAETAAVTDPQSQNQPCEELRQEPEQREYWRIRKKTLYLVVCITILVLVVAAVAVVVGFKLGSNKSSVGSISSTTPRIPTGKDQTTEGTKAITPSTLKPLPPGSQPTSSVKMSTTKTTTTTAGVSSKGPPSGSDAPRTGTFIMQCEVEAGNHDSSTISDMCWSDPETIVAGQWAGQQLIKLSLNISAGHCNQIVLNSRLRVERISCNKPDIFVSEANSGRIRIFDTFTGDLLQDWRPSEITHPLPIAVNDNYIVVGQPYNPTVHVYNRDQVFNKSITIQANVTRLYYTHLTSTNLLLITTWDDGHHLIIYDMNSGLTIVSGGTGGGVGEFNLPLGATQVTGGYLIVADQGNDRLSVWSAKGHYLHHLGLVGSDVDAPSFPSVITDGTDGITYLAVAASGNIIKIFRLS